MDMSDLVEMPNDMGYEGDQAQYELRSDSNYIETTFVFPVVMSEGDRLPSLRMVMLREGIPFSFVGEYNSITDNLEFFVEGPIGFVYKGSLQVDPACPIEGETYSWKIKRHAHTREGRREDSTQFFVPRSVCLAAANLLPSESDVVRYWTFYGKAVPNRFARLRLKLAFFPARCCENPVLVNDLSERQQSLKESMADLREDEDSSETLDSDDTKEAFKIRIQRQMPNAVDSDVGVDAHGAQAQQKATYSGLPEPDMSPPLPTLGIDPPEADQDHHQPLRSDALPVNALVNQDHDKSKMEKREKSPTSSMKDSSDGRNDGFKTPLSSPMASESEKKAPPTADDQPFPEKRSLSATSSIRAGTPLRMFHHNSKAKGKDSDDTAEYKNRCLCCRVEIPEGCGNISVRMASKLPHHLKSRLGGGDEPFNFLFHPQTKAV